MTRSVARLLLAPSLALLSACSSSRPLTSTSEPGATERGLASWYGAEFANLPTASGEIFEPEDVSAAHRTLPLGTVVDVTNERNGKTVRVRVNDRGPFVAGRIIDLSKGAAEKIDAVADGVVPVRLTIVSFGSIPTPERGDVAAREPAIASAWAVQAGAFGSEENAARLRDRLAERYPSPFLEEYQGLKRVKFGPYASREEADAARATLAELGLAGIVVPYR